MHRTGGLSGKPHASTLSLPAHNVLPASNSFFLCAHTPPVQTHAQAACYNIGGADYVLDDLENGILRGNAPGAASLGMLLKLPWLSKGPFKAGDPRAQHVSQGGARAGQSRRRQHHAVLCIVWPSQSEFSRSVHPST